MPERARAAETRIEQCLLELRALILKGAFAPGERIAELALAARLGVSRTPLRLALDRLAGQGLLKAGPRGFVVRRFEWADLWDAIELRGVLEGTAARLAAERLETPAELGLMRSIEDDIDALMPLNEVRFARYLELNEEFHGELKRLCKSPMVVEALNRVLELPFAAPGSLVFGTLERTSVDRFAHIAREHHRALIEAIGAREGTRAEAVAREHSRLARKNLSHALKEGSASAEVPGGRLIRLDEEPGRSSLEGRPPARPYKKTRE